MEEALLLILGIFAETTVMLCLFFTNMQLFTSQDVNWWTREEWIIEMFLSTVWTLILRNKLR